MKKLYPFAVVILLVLGACKNPQPAPAQQQQTPEALQENNKDYSLVSKSRSYSNLVEELYSELAEKEPALNAQEENIIKVTESKNDPAAAFNSFNQKNNTFYDEAAAFTARITDSSVKTRIKQLLDNSSTGYKNKTAAHNSLIETINKKDIALADLHIVLKLVKTMAVMEKYQNDQLPSLKPLQTVSNNYDSVITTTKTLSGQ